jgi:flagellar motor switch protein FliG
MAFEGGIKAAAKMLIGLSKSARDKVIETISKKDPAMAVILQKSMYEFSDLKDLTPLMVIELLRSVNPRDLGMALRISGPELKNLILSNAPKLMRNEIEEVLMGPLQLATKVEEAQEKIMEVVRKKIEKGELVINKDSKETLV